MIYDVNNYINAQKICRIIFPTNLGIKSQTGLPRHDDT